MGPDGVDRAEGSRLGRSVTLSATHDRFGGKIPRQRREPPPPPRSPLGGRHHRRRNEPPSTPVPLPKPPERTRSPTRSVPLRWLEDGQHEAMLTDALAQARVSLWIATANLKAVRLEAPIGSVARARRRYVSIVERFAELSARGVELRVLHAGPPSRAFREALEQRASLQPSRRWLRQCPRVHFKIVTVDGAKLYLGSANLTGAGLGAKGDARRNFELGITTTDHVLLDAAQRRFDRIWSGGECAACKVRGSCPQPLDTP